MDTQGTSEPEKNSVRFVCQFCPSVILQPGFGRLEISDFSLPKFHKNAQEESELEPVNKCWIVQDMFHFENVGFSKPVGNVKYLLCADCEMGPIGWHYTDSKLCYVADHRVKHVA